MIILVIDTDMWSKVTLDQKKDINSHLIVDPKFAFEHNEEMRISTEDDSVGKCCDCLLS